MKKVVLTLIALGVSTLYAGFSFNFVEHTGAIWAIEIHDGEVYTAGADGVVNIWKLGSMNLLRTIYSHTSWARAIEVTDNYIIVGGYKPDNNIKIFSREDGRLINTFSDHDGSIFTIVATNAILASGGSDNIVVVRNILKNKIIAKYHAHSGWVRDLNFYKNYLVSSGDDGKVVFFDLKKLKVEKTVKLSGRVIKVLIINNMVFAVLSNGVIYEIFPKVKKVYSQGNITTAFVALKKKQVYLGDNTGRIYILSTNFKLLKQLKIFNSSVTSISGFKEIIYAGNSEGKIKLYNVKTNEIVSSFPGEFQIRKMIYKDNLLYVITSSKKLVVYNVLNGKVLKNVSKNDISNIDISDSVYYSNMKGKIYNVEAKSSEIFQTQHEVTLLRVFKNKLIVGTYEYLFIIDKTNGELENYFESENSWFISFYYNRGKIFLGTSSGELFILNEKFSLIWRKKISNSLIVGFAGFDEIFVSIISGKVFKIDFLKDLVEKVWEFKTNLMCETYFNKEIILGTYDGFYVLTAAGYRLIKTSSAVVALESSNEKLFVGLANGTINVYDKDYILSQVLREGENKILAVDVSLDGEYVVTGSADNKVKLWKVIGKEFKLEKTMVGHDDWVRAVLFIDNKYIASGSADKTIKIWDKNSGRLVRTFSEHNGYVWALAYKKGVLYSGGWDNKLIARNIESGEILFELKTSSAVTDMVIWKNFLFASEVSGQLISLDLKSKNILITEVSSNTIWDIDIYKDLIALGDEKGKIYVYNLNSFEKLFTIDAHRATVFTVKVYQDKIITASVDNTLKVFNFKGELIKTYKGFTQAVLAIAVDPQRNAIITSGGLSPTFFQLP